MSETVTTGVGGPRTTSDRRLRISAGLGGVLAAGAWAVQPFLVVVVAGDEGGGLPTLDYLLARPWSGPVEAAVFTGVGLGILLLVLSLNAMSTARTDAVSPPSLVGRVLGIFAGCTWILLAGWYAGPYTSVGESLGEATSDQVVQRAVLHIHSVGFMGILLAGGIGFALWLVWLATTGRRTGVVGRPLAIVAVVSAVASLQPFLMPFTPPWGMLLGMPAFGLVAGVAFLVKARRTP